VFKPRNYNRFFPAAARDGRCVLRGAAKNVVSYFPFVFLARSTMSTASARVGIVRGGYRYRLLHGLPSIGRYLLAVPPSTWITSEIVLSRSSSSSRFLLACSSHTSVTVDFFHSSDHKYIIKLFQNIDRLWLVIIKFFS